MAPAPACFGALAGSPPMTKKFAFLLSVCGLALSLTSGAEQAPASRQATPAPRGPVARAEKAVPFAPGETLTYDVSWSSFLTAGTATVSVRDKRPANGSMAYYIVAEGRPTPFVARLYSVYYKADTLMDVYSLLPQRGSVFSDEAGDRRTKTTLFNQSARTATYDVQTSTHVRRNLRVPSETRDPLSAIYAVRALPMRPGGRARIPVADNGDLLQVDVTIAGRETVSTGLGTVTAWRLVPAIYDAAGAPETSRRMALWISDDERRLPLKMQAELPVGTFDFTLRSASPAPPLH